MKRAESVPKDDKLFGSFVDFCSSQPCALCVCKAYFLLTLFLLSSSLSFFWFYLLSLSLSTHCLKSISQRRPLSKTQLTQFSHPSSSLKFVLTFPHTVAIPNQLQKNNRIFERWYEKGFSMTKRQRTSHPERRRQRTRAKHFHEPKASTSRLSHPTKKQEQSFSFYNSNPFFFFLLLSFPFPS